MRHHTLEMKSDGDGIADYNIRSKVQDAEEILPKGQIKLENVFLLGSSFHMTDKESKNTSVKDKNTEVIQVLEQKPNVVVKFESEICDSSSLDCYDGSAIRTLTNRQNSAEIKKGTEQQTYARDEEQVSIEYEYLEKTVLVKNEVIEGKLLQLVTAVPLFIYW